MVAAFALNVRSQGPDGSFVAVDLSLVFTNLQAARVIAAIHEELVLVLLQLPLIPLQFALVRAKIHRAGGLAGKQGSRAHEQSYG